MAIVRYEPPDEGGTPVSEGLSAVGTFFSDPIGTIVRVASGQKKQPPNYYPVEIDTVTGRVNIIGGIGSGIPEKKRNPAHIGTVWPDPKFIEKNAVRTKLEQAFLTGVVPTGLGPYKQIAELIAKLPHDVQEPDQEGRRLLYGDESTDAQTDTVEEPRSQFEEIAMAGYLPPGGLSGFAQMTPASRLALTQGVRRTVGRRRRKKTTRRARKSKRTKKGRRKLVKGSAAAKRFMANLRRKRRK